MPAGNDSDKLNILMAGPDRSVHGGISGVVNGYYEAGLDTRVNLAYIGTMKEGSKPYKLFVAICAYIRFICKLQWADIVHIHVASDSSFVRKGFFVRAAHRHHKRIVLHQHGGELEAWSMAGGMMRLRKIIQILDMADEIIAISPAYRETIGLIASSSSAILDKIAVMPNSVRINGDLDSYSYRGDSRRVVFLGRICAAKGICELIDAMKKVRIVCPDAELVLGGIIEEEKMSSLIKANSEFVRYEGWVLGDAKRKLLLSGSVFVMPSYFEGQSVAILEAMNAGCLVIGSDVGGIPMMVHDGETGLLIKPGDTESLAQAILYAFSDDNNAECTKMCQAAAQMIRQEYNIDKYIDSLMAIYQRITETSKPVRKNT